MGVEGVVGIGGRVISLEVFGGLSCAVIEHPEDYNLATFLKR